MVTRSFAKLVIGDKHMVYMVYMESVAMMRVPVVSRPKSSFMLGQSPFLSLAVSLSSLGPRSQKVNSSHHAFDR